MSRWALNAVAGVLMKRGLREMLHTQRRNLHEDRAERDLKILASKIQMAWPQAKECQQPPEAGRGKELILPWGL